MKNIFIITIVLTMASLAGADLILEGYDGSPLTESDIITLEIWGDGGTIAYDPTFLNVLSGPGTVDVDSVTHDIWYAYPAVIDLGDLLGQQTIMFNTVNPATVPYPLDGLIATIDFHCEGFGDVVIQLLNGITMEMYDEIVITQVPEPLSLSLLALSGLLIRKRK